MKSALAPDAAAFLKGDAPASIKPNKPGKESGKDKKSFKKPAALPPSPTPPGPLALVSVTYRLPGNVVDGLARASLERKLAKQKPYTQQDIIAVALQDWLRRQPAK